MKIIIGIVFGYVLVCGVICRLTHSGDFNEQPMCWCKGKRR